MEKLPKLIDLSLETNNDSVTKLFCLFPVPASENFNKFISILQEYNIVPGMYRGPCYYNEKTRTYEPNIYNTDLTNPEEVFRLKNTLKAMKPDVFNGNETDLYGEIIKLRTTEPFNHYFDIEPFINWLKGETYEFRSYIHMCGFYISMCLLKAVKFELSLEETLHEVLHNNATCAIMTKQITINQERKYSFLEKVKRILFNSNDDGVVKLPVFTVCKMLPYRNTSNSIKTCYDLNQETIKYLTSFR